MRFLNRFRIDFGVFELDEIAFIGRDLLGPNRFHRLDIFIRAVAAPFVRHAKHAEFVGLAGCLGAEADAYQQTAVGEVV